MHILIYRFDPNTDQKPYMQEFFFPKNKYHAPMLLDALLILKETQDASLTFRRSCAQGVCGSDGMNINGQNGLACVTPLSSLGDKVMLRPLSGMPVLRDLMVDMDLFYAQYFKVKPWLQNSGPIPATERLQSPKQREKLDGLYECILCACCTSSCPSYWWNPEKFLGPAASLQAARFIFDSRDDATATRLEQVEDAYSIFRCRTIMNCAKVCPKNLNPSKAISDIRHKLLDDGI